MDMIDLDQKYSYNPLYSFSPIHPEFEEDLNNLNYQFNIENNPTEDIFDNDSFYNNYKYIFNQKNENKKEGDIKENKIPNSDLQNHISNINTDYQTKKAPIFKIRKVNNKLTGRKRKSDDHNNLEKDQTKCHDKYYKDNMTRKLKTKLIDDILFQINTSLKEEEEEKKEKNAEKSLKYPYTKVFLLNIDIKVKTNNNALYNRQLLLTKNRDIFSNKICANCLRTNKFEIDYNKKYIDKIYKDNTKKKTIAILEKTLLESLEHYRGSKYYEELKGLEIGYQNFINEMKDEKEYIDKFTKFVNKFEFFYLNEKIPRKKEE